MNLIVTCARHMEQETRDELGGFLEEFGDAGHRITVTGMSGILVADTALDPVAVSKGIRAKLEDEPWSVRYCLRVIPVQEEAEPNVASIREAVLRLSKSIGEDESYRISVERRDSDISSREIIGEVAGIIKNRVSLESPDKTVLVEILGERAGVSVLEKSDILSVKKARRDMS